MSNSREASSHLFLVPDYYPDFSCKGSACRHTCCEGWTISMPMTDYFRLVGLDCTPELRTKLDCALKILPHPMPERYAEINPTYEGLCPFLENGLCSLQLTMGEDALMTACRYYPRGIHSQFGYECSCSGSCEAVIERFLVRKTKLRFLSVPLSFRVVLAPPFSSEICNDYALKRKAIFRILQDRRGHLYNRIFRVGTFLCGESVSMSKDRFFAAVCEMLETFGTYSFSTTDYCQLAAKKLRLTEGADIFFTEIPRAQKRFEGYFPDWHIFFEHILVNFVFYEGFPFSERHEDPAAEVNALFALYLLLYYTAIGCTSDSDVSALIDLLCSVLRFAEHSNFTEMIREDHFLRFF
jgi:hypothetical protein